MKTENIIQIPKSQVDFIIWKIENLQKQIEKIQKKPEVISNE